MFLNLFFLFYYKQFYEKIVNNLENLICDNFNENKFILTYYYFHFNKDQKKYIHYYLNKKISKILNFINFKYFDLNIISQKISSYLFLNLINYNLDNIFELNLFTFNNNDFLNLLTFKTPNFIKNKIYKI